MSFYLAFKEVWRNRGRFFLFSLVIGLDYYPGAIYRGFIRRSGNCQQTISGQAGMLQLLVFQKNVDLIGEHQPDRIIQTE